MNIRFLNFTLNFIIIINIEFSKEEEKETKNFLINFKKGYEFGEKERENK